MTKRKQDRSRRRLIGASGAEALALSFEALVTLLGLIPGSVHRGELYLLNDHWLLKTGRLGCQRINL